MKLLNICYNKGLGGLEEMFLHYSRGFASLGWEVVSMIPPAAKMREEAKECSDVITNSAISSSISHFNPFKWWQLRRTVKQLRPDLIILHNARPFKLIQKAARGICPVVVVHHGGNLARSAQSEHVVCITHYMKAEFESLGKPAPHLYYVPNVFNGKIMPARKNVGSKPLRLGFIGRLVKVKGVSLILKALARCEMNVQLHIAGEGEIKEALQKQVSDIGIDATFHGWITGKKKQHFFENIDGLIVPSYFEPFGLVIIEGWAAGVPVLSSKTKGGLELIEHEKNGLLFDIGDANALAKMIHHLEKIDISTMTKKAQKDLSAFSNEQFTEHLARMVRQVGVGTAMDGHLIY